MWRYYRLGVKIESLYIVHSEILYLQHLNDYWCQYTSQGNFNFSTGFKPVTFICENIHILCMVYKINVLKHKIVLL